MNHQQESELSRTGLEARLAHLERELGRRNRGRRTDVATAVVLSFSFGALGTALAVDLPFKFEDGQVARAEEVNANFAALSDAIDRITVPVSVDGLGGGTITGATTVSGALTVERLVLGGHTITSTDGNLAISDDTARLEITADGDIVVAGRDVVLTATRQVDIDGASAHVDGATVSVGGTSVHVSASAIVDIDGALIQLN